MSKKIISLRSTTTLVNRVQEYKILAVKILVSLIGVALLAIIVYSAIKASYKNVTAEEFVFETQSIEEMLDFLSKEDHSVVNSQENIINHDVIETLLPSEMQNLPEATLESTHNISKFSLMLNEDWVEKNVNEFRNEIYNIDIKVGIASGSLEHCFEFFEGKGNLGSMVTSTVTSTQSFNEGAVVTEVLEISKADLTVYNLRILYAGEMLSAISNEKESLGELINVVSIPALAKLTETYLIDGNPISMFSNVYGLSVPIFEKDTEVEVIAGKTLIKNKSILGAESIVCGEVDDNESFKVLVSNDESLDKPVTGLREYNASWSKLPSKYYEWYVGSNLMCAYTFHNPITNKYVYFCIDSVNAVSDNSIMYLNVISKKIMMWRITNEYNKSSKEVN